MSKSKSLSAALAAVFMSVAAASLATTPANAAQKASVGLAKGSQSHQKKNKSTGVSKTPVAPSVARVVISSKVASSFDAVPGWAEAPRPSIRYHVPSSNHRWDPWGHWGAYYGPPGVL